MDGQVSKIQESNLVRQRIARIKLRIETQLEASKQFLVVLIGLAVTNAVAEKLKYSIDGNTFGLRMVGQPDAPPPAIAYSVSSTDSLYDFLFNSQRNLSDILILGVFFVYVVRFFFNNYTYLSELYGKDGIAAARNDKQALLSLRNSSSVDFVLSVITGLIVCLISMVLTQKRMPILLMFLVVHYFVDAFFLGIGIVRTYYDQKKDKIDEEQENANKRRIAWRAFLWICNNLAFGIMFLIIISKTYTRIADINSSLVGGGDAAITKFLDHQFLIVIGLWFANSVIALTITWWKRERPGDWPDSRRTASPRRRPPAKSAYSAAATPAAPE